MKVVFKIILLLGVLSYLVFAITTLSQHSEERVCVGSEVIINGKVDKDYITPRFIENIIAATEIPIKGALVNNIDVRHIESSILSSPYVDSVTCYYTSGNLLCVKVVPRIPILHAVPNQGESFYMDANGNSMPTDQFLLDLSLVTGYVTTEFAKEKLLELAQFMNTQAPWNREIQQIHVTSNQRIELVPMKGEHIIVLGSSADVEDKMKRLGAFYDATSENMAWQRYATLDLSYEGQIVCKKKKNK